MTKNPLKLFPKHNLLYGILAPIEAGPGNAALSPRRNRTKMILADVNRTTEPDPGFQILASTSWLPHPGFQMLARTSWLPGAICSYLELSAAICSYLQLSATVCMYLELSAAIYS